MPSTFILSPINQNYCMSICVHYDRAKVLGVFKRKDLTSFQSVYDFLLVGAERIGKTRTGEFQ